MANKGFTRGSMYQFAAGVDDQGERDAFFRTLERANWQGSGVEARVDGDNYMSRFERGGGGAPAVQKLMALRYRQWAMETGVESGISDLRGLFGSIDVTSLSSGFDGKDVLSEEVRGLAGEIEAFVNGHDLGKMGQDRLTESEKKDWTRLFVEEFNEHFEGRAMLRYKNGQGYFARLAKIQIPGSERMGSFTFAILPHGDCAPDHRHNGSGDFAGEYIVSLFGELMQDAYDGTTGNAHMRHSKGDAVRKSADGSEDKYAKQLYVWGGFFLQPANADLI